MSDGHSRRVPHTAFSTTRSRARRSSIVEDKGVGKIFVEIQMKDRALPIELAAVTGRDLEVSAGATSGSDDGGKIQTCLSGDWATTLSE